MSFCGRTKRGKPLVMRASSLLAPLALAFALGPAVTARAEEAPPAVHLDVRRATLPNGLRVVLSVSPTSGAVAVALRIDVGSRNELRGQAGFAHLVERMLRGDRQDASGETSRDGTTLVLLAPREDPSRALSLQASRLKPLEASTGDLDASRRAIEGEFGAEERDLAGERLDGLVYQGYWPYEHEALGSKRDVEAAQLDGVRAFHDAFYGPNDAILVLVGDFDPEAALVRIRAAFSDARPVTPPKLETGTLPEQAAPREDVVEDAHARAAALLFGWAIPPAGTPEHDALEIAAHLLTDGDGSRLRTALVRGRAIAADATAWTHDRLGPDVFELRATASGKETIASLDAAITDAILHLAKSPPAIDEVARTRRQIAARFLLDLQSNEGRATELAAIEASRGDASLVNAELDRYLAVSSEDVSRAVAKYLAPNRRSRVEVKPSPNEAKVDAKRAPKQP
jgi:zinc protease